MAQKPVVAIIRTFLCCPPLEARDYDWEAFYEEDELDEARVCGFGRTREAAVSDLRTRFPR